MAFSFCYHPLFGNFESVCETMQALEIVPSLDPRLGFGWVQLSTAELLHQVHQQTWSFHLLACPFVSSYWIDLFHYLQQVPLVERPSLVSCRLFCLLDANRPPG